MMSPKQSDHPAEIELEWQMDDIQTPSDQRSDQEEIMALLACAAQGVLDLERPLPGKYQACVVLTDDTVIRKTNERVRGIDSATDVLSFPQCAFAKGTARNNPARLRGLVDPDTGRRHLGDVMISLERAQAQAEEYGHPLRREMAYLLVHGICHLLGYDHLREADKAAMRAMEEAALAQVELTRHDPSQTMNPT